MIRQKSWLLLTILLALVWLVWQWPDDRLHLIFCDVGQGDASLIVKGSFQMLIDTGPSEEKIASCLGQHVPFWDRKLEVVLISHNQRDHGGALGKIEEEYEIGKLVREGVRGDIIRYANLEFEILSPTRVGRVWGARTDIDLNVLSIVGRLKWDEFEALFTGDIGLDQEEELLEAGLLEEIDVLKVAHHGSKYSSGQPFLEVVRPQVAVIQVGKNSFGHPTAEVLERLNKLEIKVFRNDWDGEVEIISDGSVFWVKE